MSLFKIDFLEEEGVLKGEFLNIPFLIIFYCFFYFNYSDSAIISNISAAPSMLIFATSLPDNSILA